MRVGRFIRRAFVYGRFAVSHFLRRGLAVYDEGDGVFVHRLVVDCRISCFAVYCFNRLIPTRKGIGVLRVGRFIRRAFVFGRFAISYFLRRRYAVYDEGNRILVHRFGKGCFVACRTRYFFYFGRPACEGISILRVRFLRRIRYAGNGAVRYHYFLIYAVVFVQEGNLVFVYRLRVRCRKRYVARNHDNRLIPACEGVGILRVRRLRGRFAVIHGHTAVSNLARLQYRAVFVEIFNGIFVNRPRRRQGDVTRNSRCEIVIRAVQLPTGKRVTRLRGVSRLRCRRIVFHRFRRLHAVYVEGYRVGVDRPACHEFDIARNERCEIVIRAIQLPTCKRITHFRRVGRLRCRRVVFHRFRYNRVAAVRVEGYRVGVNRPRRDQRNVGFHGRREVIKRAV